MMTTKLSAFPAPLYAVQRYVPCLARLMFVIFQVDPLCSTSLSLPFLNTIVQVMFGAGLPDASQNNLRDEPSGTVWSWLTLMILGETEKNNSDKTTRKNFKARKINSVPIHDYV